MKAWTRPGGNGNGREETDVVKVLVTDLIHSSDLRYMFGTLDRSWRPYKQRDYEASGQMMDYLVNFARTGDPNGPGLPLWRKGKPALRIGPKGTNMGHVSYYKLLKNMLTKGDPKA